MKKKSLQLLIKRQKIIIDQLSAKVAAKKEEMDALLKKRISLLKKIETIEKERAPSVAQLALSKEYVFNLYKQIEALDTSLQALGQELDAIKKELHAALGEKKAFEKLLSKLEEKAALEEIHKESRLADESFARKFMVHR